MLEINTVGLHRYHKLDQAVIRIGRALDNDIILSDETVAPHHLTLRLQSDGRVELENTSAVNPVLIKGKTRTTLTPAELPTELRVGRISARILPLDHKVASTRAITGHGHQNHLFGHIIWPILLVLLCFLVAGLEFYFHSYQSFKWDMLAKHLFKETALGIGAFILVLSVLERLLVNRWEIKPVTITVCLIFLSHYLLSQVVDKFAYLFSSDLPADLFHFGWYFLLIPAVISFYLIRITHLRTGKSLLLAVMISSPFAILATIKNPTVHAMFDQFSATAKYQKRLQPLNWHFSDTISIETFIEQAEQLPAGKFAD